MEIRILGPLQVVDGERDIAVPAGRIRALLAVLACRANRVVSVPELVSQLWDEPGAGAHSTVRSYVRRLRNCLSEIDSQRVFVRQRAPGYVLELGEHELDLLRFRSLASAAEHAADPHSAAELLGAALALWRGQPLADVGSDVLARGVLPALEEEHTRAVEARLTHALAAGAGAELVGELTGLVERYPLRERFWEQLMVALGRSGRQAEALAAYQRLRERLADELGVDPGPGARRAHEAVLRGEVDSPETTDPGVVRSPPTPRQLVADIDPFIGRAALVDELAAELVRRPLVLSGQPGVGKTALAVRLAHRVAARFPDGALVADLHGFSDTPAVPAGDVLTRFLSALGCDPARVPDAVDERAALLRSTLHGRRVLLVLDNARSADQVRPLLPGTAGCAVIVTSRQRLSGLAAVDGARTVALEPLGADESASLLARLLAPGGSGSPVRGVTEGELRDVATVCGGLPLALRIAAAQWAARPELGVTEFLTALSREPLGSLAVPGDRRACVRTAVEWSYAVLPDPARRLLLVLTLLPRPEFSLPVAAVLADRDLTAARELVAVLEEANLAQRQANGRYRVHDLVWATARRCAERDLPDESRVAAIRRLAEFYLYSVIGAGRFVRRAPLRLDLPTRPDTVPALPLDSVRQAVSWYESERANLLTVVRESERRGWHRVAYLLPVVLCTFYVLRGHRGDWGVTHRLALRAARRAGDRRAESVVLHRLGALHNAEQRYDEARDAYEAAIAAGRQVEDPLLEASALTGLGTTHRAQGRFTRAQRCYERALALQTEVGDPYGPVGPLVNSTLLHTECGRFEEAFACAREAIRVAMAYGSVSHPAVAWLSLGEAYARAGRDEDAAESARTALRLAEVSEDLATRERGLRLLARTGAAPETGPRSAAVC
ncbi:AfsR/SARP family transcriptional regulator [Saccharomonospora piscinae]|uniref:AfsR/SARP family transcriptional regulator n=1 Tax=Saccharomonospora piscinae TaxID=687388 RepID=UPI0004646C12|nr:BTAD domain-containing putative transcriptional regulator [Saccharomonospora piscinae]